MSTIKNIRERINLFLYDKKKKVLTVLTIMNVIISLSSLGILVYYFGFDISEEERKICFKILQWSFAFYIFRFFTKFFFDFYPLQFLRKNWLEGVVILLLVIEGVSYNLTGNLVIEPLFRYLGFSSFADFSMIFIQLFVFLLIILSVVRKENFKPWLKIHPGWMFVLSISTMTLIGGLLLMLPEMSRVDGGMKFIDSIFLSMSSVSVTGLSTVSLASDLTFKGQVIVLILIKLGGLNTIAFGALMLVAAKFGVGIKYHEIIEDFINEDSIISAKSMLTKIIVWATTIELIGFILLFISFGNEGLFSDFNDRFFQSLFHGVSAFNNAGLSILEGGMMHPDVINNMFVHTIVLILFFLGGLGMIYVFDLFDIRRIRERIKYPWKTIDFGTKISLYFTLALLFLGAIIFLALEWNNTLDHEPFYKKIIISLYESMTTRNAGFNVVDTNSISMPVLIIFLVLMFIGASSGSAGGGIRTSTFAIMYASLISTIKGYKYTQLFKRTISNDLVMKAYAIFLFFIVGNIVGVVGLSITESEAIALGKFTFLDIVFEHVSAASTVGLSTGITSDLSTPGKIILIIAMFIGRVGTLTIAYLVGKKAISSDFKYPSGHTMVG